MNLGIIKTTAKKYPLGTVAALVLIVMLSLLFVRRSAMADLRVSLELNTEESQRHLANISHSNQLAEHVQALENANRTIASRLVDPQNLAINLEYFYKLERETGVKLLDTRPALASSVLGKAAPTMKGGYKPVQYTVSLQGSYTRALTFLRRLEQGSYYCRVVTANCNPAQEETNAAAGDKKTAPEIILSLTVEILGKA
ncbi:MAG: hypothetical protein QM715_06820 [Nibricoccus sp.]